MNERERWIVYPLLFFALGAALRDKFLQHVTTDELFAKRIICDELSVRDPATEGRLVAKLYSQAPNGAQAHNDNRFGVLALFDSEGRELCGVTNDALQVRHINCDELVSEKVAVVDPVMPQRPLALLTTGVTQSPSGGSRRVGSLALIDHEGNAIFGLANDQMQMRNIVCQGIAVVAPEDQSHLLAVLGSALVKANDQNAKPQRVGVLQLNDQRLIGLTGDPTEAPVDAPPPPAPIEQEQGEGAGAAESPTEKPADSEHGAEPVEEAPSEADGADESGVDSAETGA